MRRGIPSKAAQKYLKEHGVSELAALVSGGEDKDARKPSSATAEDADAPLFSHAGERDETGGAGVVDPDRSMRLEGLLTRLKAARAVLSAVRGPA